MLCQMCAMIKALQVLKKSLYGFLGISCITVIGTSHDAPNYQQCSYSHSGSKDVYYNEAGHIIVSVDFLIG